MKILQEGNKKWSVQKTCKGCQAVLLIEKEDIQYEITEADIDSQQYELDIEGTYFVECPSCGQYIKFRNKEIPTVIKEKIRGNK